MLARRKSRFRICKILDVFPSFVKAVADETGLEKKEKKAPATFLLLTKEDKAILKGDLA